jgi:hypothetical protein
MAGSLHLTAQPIEFEPRQLIRWLIVQCGKVSGLLPNE